MLRKFHYISFLLALCLLAGTAPRLAAQNTSGHNFEVAKNLDIFNALYRDLDLYFVDTLDAQRNIDNAANYMLQMLDPYTEYYPESDTDELQQMTTGKYAGIGAVTPFRPSERRCIISEVFKGMPADVAGVHPGDVLLAVDGHTFDECRSDDADERADYALKVRNALRGEPGTTLQLKVRRPGTHKTLTFRITRSNIARPSVTLATIASDSIGYVHLSQFIEGSSNELRRALVELKQQGARRLILDLRSNPGGVLDEAVKVVNLFVPRGREVVSTKGKVKELNHTYKTPIDAVDTDIPLVVLVNSHSASSAEITAGALQDYDRAVIMGRRTYGKGLVQQSRELPYKAVLKLTTGKYYIPSGRCVQAYTYKDGEPVHTPDSLSREFRTGNGRIVRDGGGITPDIPTPTDSLPDLVRALAQSDQLFDFCVYYRNNHPTIAQPTTFRLSDVEYADFCAYMQKAGFAYDARSRALLGLLRQTARREGYADSETVALINSLEDKFRPDIEADFRRFESQIRREVESALLSHYYYEEGQEAYDLLTDPDVKSAVDVLHDDRLIYKTLSGEPEA